MCQRDTTSEPATMTECITMGKRAETGLSEVVSSCKVRSQYGISDALFSGGVAKRPKATVCKTVIRRFESDRRLLFPVHSNHIQYCRKRLPGNNLCRLPWFADIVSIMLPRRGPVFDERDNAGGVDIVILNSRAASRPTSESCRRREGPIRAEPAARRRYARAWFFVLNRPRRGRQGGPRSGYTRSEISCLLI